VNFEIRADNTLHITGYVNCTDKESHWLPSPKGRFKEVVPQGLWKRAISKASNILLLFNHEESKQLGSLKDGSMSLEEDAIGLKIRCSISDAEIVEKAKSKKDFLHSWSFGFEEISSTWERTKEGYERRTLNDIKLHEISLLGGISRAAYPATSIVEVRKDENIFLERRYSDFDIQESNIADLRRYEHQYNYLKLKGMV
jgi:HK97 family phage prohead protease